MRGDRLGVHRVLEPAFLLPQPARRLDNRQTLWDNEILIDVSILNITSTAFQNIRKKVGDDKELIAQEILQIVNERGKFQCPVTGSGGMLIGRVKEIGPALQGKVALSVGQKIATMVSLSLTPLNLHKILDIDLSTDQVFVEGSAILFESGLWAPIPTDLSEALAVAVMDVAGAPAWTAKMVTAGQTVAVFGTGKAGLLCLHEAKKRTGPSGLVIAVEPSAKQCQLVEQLGLADVVLQLDATKPLEVLRAMQTATDGRLCDFVVNTVNVPDTEMATILSCREHGQALFFSMSTSFSKAALGCEGVGKIVNLLIGTGYTEGHAEITYNILRENALLRGYFESVYRS